MTTGQYPKRRETYEQARARADRLEARMLLRRAAGRPLGEIEAKMLRPRVSSAGNLRRGL